MADGTTAGATTLITSVSPATPVITTPSTIAAVERAPLNLKGIGLAVSDADATTGLENFDVTVADGALTAIAGSTGVIVSNITGGVRIRGTIAQISNFLSNSSDSTFSYLNASNTPDPTDDLFLSLNDGAQTGVATSVINVAPVNSAPTINAPILLFPGALEQTEFSLKTSPIVIGDADGGSLTVTLTVSEGVLRATAGDTGVTITGPKEIPPEYLLNIVDPQIEASQLIVTGTVAQINAFLSSGSSRFVYFNGSDTPADSAVLSISVNDGQASATSVTDINIVDVNDAPVVTVATATLSAVEQVFLNLKTAGVTVADVDAQGSVETLVLSVGEGGINAAVGATGVTLLSGNNTSSVTLRGTIAQLNAFLSQASDSVLRYIDASDTPASSTTFAIALQDRGTPDDLARSGVGHVTLNIGAVNDAPTIAVTGTYGTDEQLALGLRGAVLVGDVDAGSSPVTVTLSVTQGTITIGTGGHAVTVTDNGSSAVTLRGTIAELDAVLRTDEDAQVTYFNNSDAPDANVTVTAAINDGGNTGSGGAKSASTTFNIAITPVNDAPDANVTATTYTATEQISLDLKNTGITVSDPDSGSASVTAVLSVTSGLLTVTAGASGAIVSGSGTGTVTITGPVAAINALLTTDLSSTVSYVNTSDAPPPTAELSLTINDGGATGGGALSDIDGATINITPVNDGPTADAPDGYTATEQTTLDLKNTGLMVSDPDSAGAFVTVTLTVGQGALTVMAGGSGATVSGSGTSAVTLTGTAVQINNLLTTDLTSTVSYFNNLDASAATTDLALTISDNGATGGGALNDFDTAVITITPVNDAPTAIATQTNLSVTEGQSFSLKGQGFSVADPDAANSPVTVTLTVDEGVIDIDAGLTGVTIVSGDNTGTVVLSGTIAQINSLLGPDPVLVAGASLNAGAAGSVDYTVTSDDPVEDATFTLSVNDGGATGGGALTGSVSVAVDIVTVNDAPTIAFAGSITATEQVAASLKGFFTLDDADAQGGLETLTLTVAEGTLAVDPSSSGVTVVSGNGSATLVLSGTIDSLNTLLAAAGAGELVFTATSNTPSASVNLGVTLSDGGNAGDTGGVQTATREVTIAVTAINDAPVVDIRVNFSADEQIEAGLKGDFIITDADSGNTDITATLSVTNGVLNVFEGSSGAVVTGSGSSTVTIVGTVIEIRDLLNANDTSFIRYLNDSDAPPESAELTFTVNDGGATGTGGAKSATDTTTIRITAVNDAPTLTGPATIAATEQTAVSLKGVFTANDSDGPTTLQTLVLTSPNGFTATAGNSGATVTPGDGNITVTGTLAQIQAFLGTTSTSTLSYINPSDTPPASVAITATLTDESGVAASYTGAITIAEVNDAPTATAPATYAVDEQASISLKNAALQIADVDDDGGPVTATLAVAFGTLTVAPGILGSIGATVTGSGSSSVQLRGTIAQINALLSGDSTSQVTFASTSDAPPASTLLTLSVNDEGNGGTPAQTGQATSTINIRQINDGPDANILVTDIMATERMPLSLKEAGLSVSDPDSGTNIVIATLGVGEGTITVNAGGSGTTVAAGNNGTSLVTITGTIAQINALLNSDATSTITYVNNSDTPSTLTTFILGINDTGSTGGGSLTDSDSANIRLTTVNSAPTNITGSGPFSTAENAAAGTVVGQVAGVDPDSTTFTYSLTNNAGGRFAVDNAGVVTVANGLLLDFEQATSHTVTVRATDSGGLFFDKAFTVAVSDVVGETVSGDAGANTVFGGSGVDTIMGQQGADTLYGGLDNDILYGNQEADALYGNQGNDALYGGQGDDLIFGGQGDDFLFGNLGNDVLQGGIGADTLSGAGGADLFRFVTAADSPFASGFDTITDFEAGIDDIDLRAVRTGPSDTFVITTVSGVTYVDVDLGGNGSFEMRVALSGVPLVTSDDILFG